MWERKLKITFTFRFTCIIYSSFHTTIPNPKKLKRKKQQNFSQSGQTKEEAVTEYIVWFVTLLLFCFAPIQFIFNSIQFIFQMVSCTYFTFFLCILNHSLTIKLLSLLLVILVLPQIKISFKSSQNRLVLAIAIAYFNLCSNGYYDSIHQLTNQNPLHNIHFLIILCTTTTHNCRIFFF